MSLTRIALRIAAVEAIKGKTLVRGNVLDTPNGALDIQADGTLRTAEDKPFIAVFTDQGKVERVNGRSLIENGLCDIIFEMGISSAMLETDENSGASMLVGVGIPASDGNQEFFLDVVQRQIGDALADPNNRWAEIWRGLHYRIAKIEFAGARNAEDGQRLAGHQMRLTVELADDPVAREPLDPQTPFMQFLTALEGHGDRSYAEQAAFMRALINGSSEDWEQLQRRRGMTAAELLALGQGPLAADAERATPPMTSATLDVENFNSVTVTGS
ncbi:hypothetical protein [Rhizobium sp. LC145]|uniref:hypothetical protein n=1 Tax=Rhizobium sp. LC145 TaxID=1120688 RepID=UPI00062A4F46|nr:hypothetical protein [Rhizobium sp. LC145]KKX24316.1 hypothetical protein YH62_27565 [Rhizobium sp. LC145]TKT46187.1 hypothetical protein FDR95_23810 [Rhizobiaceae bacterium LC148]